MEKNYREVYGRSFGGDYNLGIKILISMDREPNAKDDDAIWRGGDIITEALLKETVLLDPEKTKATKKLTEEIEALFPQPIYMEAIPNEYCGSYCCAHIPWFNVTTRIGVIKIGWRKRVLNIDWSKTNVRKRAVDLFPNEDVTMGEYYIHAWGYEKAKQYISKLHEE